MSTTQDEGRAFVGPVGQTLYTMATLPPVTQMVPGDRVAWISVHRTDGRVVWCYGNGAAWIDQLTGAAVV